MDAGYTHDRDERGLTEMQRRVLAAAEGGLTQKEARDSLGLSKQRISQLVADLQRKGFVVRQGRDKPLLTVPQDVQVSGR